MNIKHKEFKKFLDRQPASYTLRAKVAAYSASSFVPLLECYDMAKNLGYDKEHCNEIVKDIKEFYGLE